VEFAVVTGTRGLREMKRYSSSILILVGRSDWFTAREKILY